LPGAHIRPISAGFGDNQAMSVVLPLSVSDIAAALGPLASRFDVEVLDECDSTNARLLARAEAGAAAGTVVAAERQLAGRGRMGRAWFSAPGDSLTFSLLWRFPPGIALGGLSLAVGVALADTLHGLGIAGIALKWPNDVLRDGRKLAGVLIELVPGVPHSAVIGVGLNLRLSADMPAPVRAQAGACDLAVPPSTVLARLLATLYSVLSDFAPSGFVVLRQRWLHHCGHVGRPVRIASEYSAPVAGRCVGVDVDGALLLETDTGVQRVLAGDVSLRAS
jgi:BirA family biotin operon repressor/biotin-[acetyl-CoA-carboxylase] ligase